MSQPDSRARLARALGGALVIAIGAGLFGRGGSAPAPLAAAIMLLGLTAACAAALSPRLHLGAALRPGPAGWMVLALLALAALGAFHAFYPHAAVLRLAVLAGAAGACLAARIAGADRGASEGMRAGLVLLGAVAAALALLHAAPFSAGLPVALAQDPSGGPPTGGPFVNPNHLAALLSSLLPVALAGVLFAGRRRRSRGTALLHIAGGALCLAALLASGSRGGLLAALVGLGCFGLCLRLARGRDAALWRKRGLAAALVMLLVAVFSVGATRPLSRFRPPEAGGESSIGFRLSIWESSLRAAGAGGLLGWGLGSFPWVYPAFRGPGVPYRVEHAHNDWLEGAVELGWAFPVLALGAAAALARKGIEILRRRHDRVAVGTAAAALSGLAALSAHALVDSPLEMPPLIWLAGLQAGLLAASAAPWHGPDAPDRAGRTRSPAFAAAACLAATLALSVFTLRYARSAAAMAGAERALAGLDHRGAIGLARRGASADPASAEARSLLGRVLLESRQGGHGGHLALREAVEAFQSAVETNPRDASAYLALARGAAARGDRERAASALDSAVRLDPRAGAPREARARFLLAEGRREEAMADLRASVDADARGLSRVLPILWEATSDPALARSVTPSSGDALFFLGEFLESKERPGAADAVFAEAASAEIDDVRPLAARARLALARGEPARAAALAREGLARDGRDATAMRILAGSLLASGDDAGARAAYERLLDSRPGDMGAARGLAEIAARLGRHEDAVRAWRRVIGAVPGSADARLELARAHQRAGNWRDAVETCRDLAAANPRETACRGLLVDLYLERGLTSSAKAVLRDWRGGAAGSVSSRLALARFLESAGRGRDARREYREVLEIEPGNAEARTALKRSLEAVGEGAS